MKLAINGGTPVVKNSVNHDWPNVDKEEILSILECFSRNKFSGFRAGNYEGGPAVVEFEELVKDSTNSEFAVAFDTWSNGIVAAMLALGLEAGDEVIITPYTMTSCATSIMSCGAIPIFADVCEDSGCIDPVDVEKKITDKTKAIFVVHLFGIPADMDPIMDLAKKHDLFVFEDCAQSPMSYYKGRMCGIIGDVGGYSLTESKHITSGEGGIAITNDVKINNGMRYARNHGEVASTAKAATGSPAYDYCFDVYGDSGIIGYNFRMTEVCAAFANSQWKKLDQVLATKKEMGDYLRENLQGIKHIELMIPKYDHIPSWYNFPLRYKKLNSGVSREKFVEALNAEGINFACGYVPPLYKQDIYRSNKHWVIRDYAQHVDYENPGCPVVERLYGEELIATLDIRSPYDMNHMKNIVHAVKKVCNNIHELS